MAERFTKLQAFPENLYTDMAPVVIAAGNLLKDNQLSRVLAQLKIKNIDKRTVEEITLQFRLMDANSKTLDEAFEYKIEKTGIAENEFYGAKNPITIPNGNVQSCDLKVTKVKFADGTEWTSQKDWVSNAGTDIDNLKAERERRLAEAEIERQQREAEKRRLAEIEKERIEAEKKVEREKTKKTTKKLAIVIACITVVIACIIPFILKNREAAEKEKADAIVAALIGTSWVRTEEEWFSGQLMTFTYTYTFLDAETYQVGDNDSTARWEFGGFSESNPQHAYINFIENLERHNKTREISFILKNGSYEIEILGICKENGYFEDEKWEQVK